MELIRMNEIVKIKNEVRLKQWAEMVQCRNESGLTVSEWCRQNGINPKTYYYRLKRVLNRVIRYYAFTVQMAKGFK